MELVVVRIVRLARIVRRIVALLLRRRQIVVRWRQQVIVRTELLTPDNPLPLAAARS